VRILIAHNRYRQPGGEDAVVTAEAELLARHGHTTETFLADSRVISSAARIPTAGLSLAYSPSSRRAMARAIARFRPDVLHVHNFFPLLTPAVYDAARAAGVPVVQTLHNFRTVCPGSLLWRGGRVCEDCLRGRMRRCILAGCYRGSRLATAAVAGMVVYHRRRHTWRRKVDCFIACSDFARMKLIQGGLPEEKIVTKPNFCDPPPAGDRPPRARAALYVGRLSPEKGLRTLLRAWETLDLPLRIAGSGPLEAELRATAPAPVTFLGSLPAPEISREMLTASLLVFPSEWYEFHPRVLVEAMAHGLPVAASRIGSVREVVTESRTGFTFEPGNAADLARCVRDACAHPAELLRMSEQCRTAYKESDYTPARNYLRLQAIYRRVCGGE
jgi:glycosyltransferase involved in cell wall biosynthesis